MTAQFSPRLARVLVAMSACCVFGPGVSAVDSAPLPEELLALGQARAELAAAIASGQIPLQAALARFRQLPVSAWPSGDADADYAEAALDMGQRLQGLDRPEAAQLFFKAADEALSAVIARVPDASAQQKSQYLATRAQVRGQFLQQMESAKEDLGAAEALTPGDARLRNLREQLARDKAAFFAPDGQR